jgi:hypothetical protein
MNIRSKQHVPAYHCCLVYLVLASAGVLPLKQRLRRPSLYLQAAWRFIWRAVTTP